MTIRAKFAGTCRKCGQPIAVGETIEWERGRGAAHVECPKATPETDAPYKLHGGSGYGCHGWTKGQVVRCPELVRREHPDAPEYLTIVSAKSQYYREEGMSFGVGDEDGYVYSARARAATEEEAEPVIAEERKRQEAKDKMANLHRIAKEIRETGEYLPGSHVLGGTVVPIGEGQTIYGGGEWLVIAEDRIWAVTNNGMDGDDWSRNNVRTGGAGAIGFCVPFSRELADRILANGAPKKPAEMPLRSIPRDADQVATLKTDQGTVVVFYRFGDQLLAQFAVRGHNTVVRCKAWGRLGESEGLLARSDEHERDFCLTVPKAEAERLLK